MTVLWTVFSLCAISQVVGTKRKFPDDFLFGASTSAYQIEGGWNAHGKGKSTWDYYTHKYSDFVEDRTNGGIAANSYHFYERDVAILKHLGAKSYRFSISWTRILPNGTADYVNLLGISYYRNLIDLLLANDIVPLVTIYHWDLPISFSKQGGWLNEEIVDWFGNYARVVFLAFGDKVKHWITVNEPFMHCYLSFGSGKHPPFIKSPGIDFYECGRNHLLAHATAYRIYDREFRRTQGGEVGIALDAQWPLAASHSKDDNEAVEDYLALHLGQYMDPIFKGDYPHRLLHRVATASARQGYPRSRLRPFSKEQKAFIKGTADFIGINHYTSEFVYRNASVLGMYEVPSFYDDAGFGSFMGEIWPKSSFKEMRAYPPGLFNLLLYIKNTYGNPGIIITESGFPTTSYDGLDDGGKANYIRNYLHALLAAKEAGSNCQGYFFWSLLDTFEWERGFGYKFGLYQVDFNHPNRTRTARRSALVYKEIIRTRHIDFNYDPDPYDYTPSCFIDFDVLLHRLLDGDGER